MRKIPFICAALALALMLSGTGLAELLPAPGEDAAGAVSYEAPAEAPDPAFGDSGSMDAAPAVEARDIVLAEPAAPAAPTEPLTPAAPVAPVVPAEPATPAEPVAPVVPAEPATPAEPVAPVVPAEPAAPEEPVTPAVPTEPAAPEEPLTPVVPAEPAAPEEPVSPVVPAEPAAPEEPVTPVVPAEPATPVEPVSPVVPAEPATPVEPVAPVVPAEPGAPEELVTPVSPESSDRPEESDAGAPRLLNIVARDIKGPGKKGSISGSIDVPAGHTVVVELKKGAETWVAVLTDSSNSFEFKDLEAGEYTLTITDVNTSLKLVMKQKVSEGKPDTPTAITDLSAKAEPNKIIVTGKAEPHKAVVVGTDPATQETTVVSGGDGKFTATLTCAAGTYKVWAEYANLKDTKVTMPGTVKVEDEKIDHYPTFSRGDRYHPLIYRLQQRLRELGYYTIKVDGIYGSGTERAVRLFQQVNGIHPANGVATNHTQQVLYSHSAKPYHGSMPWPGGGTLYRSPYYQPAVVPLQQRLRALGYYTGSADGYFGSGTERAVRNFQKRNGLPVTGAADPVTQQKLYSPSAIPASGGGYTPGPSTGYRLLYWGCRGEAVRRLQQALRNAGYTQVRTVDGIYGQWTYDAVRAFQRDHGLSVDGIAGRKTQNALYGTHY